MTEEINKCFIFSRDSLECSFRLVTEQREVLVYGEETENGKTIFRLVLSFSRELVKEAEQFARFLCESETFPRMMEELAEEYFADILPE